MTDLMILVGRICLSALFVWGGFGKLMAATATRPTSRKPDCPFRNWPMPSQCSSS